MTRLQKIRQTSSITDLAKFLDKALRDGIPTSWEFWLEWLEEEAET